MNSVYLLSATCFRTYALTAAFCLFSMNVLAEGIPEQPKPVFIAHFDRSITADQPSGITVKTHGGSIIQEGVSGKALRLDKGAFLSFPVTHLMNSGSGTIMFWMRPHWDSLRQCGKEMMASHTFISFQWDDPRKAYFALTDGWWESDGGRKFTYCIFQNQEFMKTDQRIWYEKDQWMHIACTWGTSEGLKFYVNGFCVGSTVLNFLRDFSPKGKLFIGSDQGTPLSRNRWGDCDIDEMSIYGQSLPAEEIFSAYTKYAPKLSKAIVPMENARIRSIRAIFDEGTGWMTKNGARETIERVKRAGFNVYIPCVWHGKGTRYPSSAAPVEHGLSSDNGDPLERLISMAHDNGIEVHPWFCVTLRQRTFLEEYYNPATPAEAFDIHNKAFRDFMVNMIMDVVARYRIDGINLDYIRTMGFCTCSSCAKQYRELSSRDLLRDVMVAGRDKNRSDTHLQDWQDLAVRDVVERIHTGVKKERPSILVSIDGFARTSDMGGHPEGREELSWANDGLIDVIFHMDYGPVPNFAYTDLVRRELAAPERLIMLLADYNETSPGILSAKSPVWIGRYVKAGRRGGDYGVALYALDLLDDAQIEVLSSELGEQTMQKKDSQD
jgi:uncharacterized lipoprotein YddW (UPF0748 family)